MPRFLHLADIHLGFDRYDNKVRTRDFFEAFRDVLQKYAVEEQVDFVVLAGDLFEHRNIQPATLNQAQVCLSLLQDAGIPVLAIEGNHDNRPYGTKTSWLRYLADWGLLILLEPGDVAAGEPFYEPWDPDSRYGGYVDLPCGVRVFGSQWYGASAPKAIEQIAAAIGELPATSNANILLFHHGLEGQIARYQGALRYPELLPLRQAGIDYLALGHIHKSYTAEGWVFNPGSLEANSIEEANYDRGAYLVEITPTGIQAELKQDYCQRAVVRLKLAAQGQETVEELEQKAAELVQRAIQTQKLKPEQEPIVELRIEGTIGFDRLELNTRQLQQQLHRLSNALIFLLKYDAESVAYATPLAEDAQRLQIEHEVFLDLLFAHNSYKSQANKLTAGLIDLKDRQIEGYSDAELYRFVETLLISGND